MRRLSREDHRARILRLPDRVVLTLGVVDPDDAQADRHELDIVVGANHVITVHDRPLAAIDTFRSEIDQEDQLGRLDATSFTAGLIDSVLAAFFQQIESIEREIDALDELAVRARADDRFLAAVLTLRRRIARLRRVLAPNREALLPLERPDFELRTDLGPIWPAAARAGDRRAGERPRAARRIVRPVPRSGIATDERRDEGAHPPLGDRPPGGRRRRGHGDEL